MQGTKALIERDATPADILAYLNADYRLRAGVDPEVDSGEELAASTTIERWRATCDLLPTKQLAPVMNPWFGMSEPITSWQAVLEPEQTRTLGELAEFIAPRVRWPDFGPARIAGTYDLAAGAFLCLRGMLARDGLPVQELRPSSPIVHFGRSHLVELGAALSKLSPTVVVEPTFTWSRRQRVGRWLAIAGIVTLLVAQLTRPWVYLAGMVLLAAGGLMTRGEPASIAIGRHRTFGELADAMARARVQGSCDWPARD